DWSSDVCSSDLAQKADAVTDALGAHEFLQTSSLRSFSGQEQHARGELLANSGKRQEQELLSLLRHQSSHVQETHGLWGNCELFARGSAFRFRPRARD